MKPSKIAQQIIDASFEDVENYEDNENLGICFHCGHSQFIEVDAKNGYCEECGKDAIQGLLEIVLWV